MDAANSQKIVGYFIEEAKEHLETLEKGILELSSAVDDEETINELFRAAHSVKGGAAMLGFTSIQKTSHRLEDAFKILRDKTVVVDQRLESLFLKGYDVLQDLIERLQGPFGLKEDEAEQIMKDAEPQFVELQNYLQQLSEGEAPTPQPSAIPQSQPTVQPSSEDLSTKIKQLLKQMLAIFKQEPTLENRQQLQKLSDDLAQLAPDENGWQKLLKVSQEAIANPKHSYHLLAPVIIKEVKLAGDCLVVNKGSEIAPSQALEQLASAKFPQILLTLEPQTAASTLTKVFNKQQLSQLVQILQTAS